MSMWKAFAFYSGATMQLALFMVVFGFLGHQLSNRWHQIWPTIAGVILGVIAGASGLAWLARQVLGEKS